MNIKTHLAISTLAVALPLAVVAVHAQNPSQGPRALRGSLIRSGAALEAAPPPIFVPASLGTNAGLWREVFLNIPGATLADLTNHARFPGQPDTVDTLYESNETFFVNLSLPGNGTIADGQGLGTILDDDFKLTLVEFSGSDVRLSFTTEAGGAYRVERTDSLAAPIAWEPVPGSEAIAGNGAVVSVSDARAAGRAQRFTASDSTDRIGE